MIKKMLVIYVLLILKLVSNPALGVQIEEILPNGLLAHAEYHQGEEDKPAVLLIHGFLTVHTFTLIQNINNELVDNGYSVLAPTLSLGINKRKTTLDCDALHLHNMDNDLLEIDWWVNWLIKKGHSKIVLLGHSSGALQIVHYANQYPHQEFSKIIAVSLISLERLNQKEFVDSVSLAKSMVAQNDNGIQNFTLAYCTNNYASPAADYLSYASWSSERVLDSLRKLTLATHIIMGGNDMPVYPGWVEDMKKTGLLVDVIPGANHFFSAGNEFELYEKILNSMSSNPTPD